MTISVCILTSAGIVLAADSRQIMQSPGGQLRVDSDHADKIFQAGPCLAAVICGQGTFYTSPSESPPLMGALFRSIAGRLPMHCSVKEAASFFQQALGHEMEKHCRITGQPAGTSFYLAGFSPEQEIGEMYRCEVPGAVILERKTNDAGLVWNGQREMIDRLILGYDPRLFELKPLLDQAELKDGLRQQCRRLQLHINFQTMPLQDAVDLAGLLVRLTIDLQRLSDGIVGEPGKFPACGGTVDLALLTPGEGFCWVQHKKPELRLW